uniref:Uncharacterized protein n=1 Tax=Tanacetum cinerariifolium TaxID=118510 RepID=A0A6L2NG36_TANCI|nr:hypothetical protein [Tanacetum cinerariifolium]
MAEEDTSQPLPPSITLIKAPQMVSYVKLPILKKGEYIFWTMKMKQYLAHTDYALWEVILNGNSTIQMTKDEAGNEIELPPVTTHQILAKTRERKSKSTLLMAISDEHLARFHGIKDAKTLWATIKTKFGGNAESKKMQKNVLKYQFEFFSVSNSEGLDKGYDKFQRLLGLFEIHGAGVSTKDANQKFLRSLPSAWSNISLIMRNKPGIDNLDIDDLYNNLKVYEADNKGSSGSSLNSQNVAFISAESISSTNEFNAAYNVSTATCHSSQAQSSSSYADELMFIFFANQSSSPQLNNEDLEQIDQDNLEEMDFKWQVAMLSMRVKRFYKKTGRKLEFNGKELVGFDKTKVECFNCDIRGYFARDCISARNSGNRSRDVGNLGYIGRDNGKRPAKEEDEKALVFQNGLGMSILRGRKSVSGMNSSEKEMERGYYSAFTLVRNVDSPSKFLMYLRFLQVFINNQVDDLSSHTTGYTSPALTQKVFANMRRIEEEDEEDEVPVAPTPPSPIHPPLPPLQEPITTPPQAQPAPPSSPSQEQPADTYKIAQSLELLKLKRRVKKLEKKRRSKSSGLKRLRKVGTSQRMHPNRGRIEAIDADEEITLWIWRLKLIWVLSFRGGKMMIMLLSRKEYNKVQTLFKPDKDEEPTKKIVAEETLLQKSFKKLKAIKVSCSHSTQDTPTDDPKEMSKEDVKNMLEIVLVTEFKRSSDEDLHEGQSTKVQKFGYILQVIKKLKLKKLDDLLGDANLSKDKSGPELPPEFQKLGERRKLWHRSQLNKFSKHNVYSTKKIYRVKSVSVMKLHGYGHLEEIMVKRVDLQLCKFKEGRYPQWCSRFLRYIDTRPNDDALRKCILNGPYIPTTVVVQAVAVTNDSPAVLKHTTVETPMNMSPVNKAHFESEKEEMWEAIERLQQGESLNIQDIKTNLFWEFGKFTSHDGETMESYYIRFYKLMNEMIRNNLTVYDASQCSISSTTSARMVKERRKPKRVKDFAYHKEKMLSCKQAKKGVPLQAEQYDWLADTDEEIDEQELEAHYAIWQRFKRFLQQTHALILSHWKSNTCIVETDDSNAIPDSPDMCEDDIQNDQNDVESDDEHVVLANLISNLKLNVNENKKIQKQLKKANTILARELKECKTILAKTSKTLGESNSVRDRFLVALQNKQTEFEKYKDFNDRTIDYDKLERKLNETLRQLAQKDIEIKEGLKLKAYEISVVKEKHDELIKHSILTKSHYEGLVKQKTKDINIMIKRCLMPLALKIQNDSFIFVHEFKQEMHADLKYVESLENKIDEFESDKAEFSNMYDMILQERKSVETKFDKSLVVRQPNAQKIPKPSVLGKPAPFSDSLERKYFSKTKSVPKTNVSEGLSKAVTAQTLTQTAREANFRNTNPHVSNSTRVNHKTNVSRPQLRSNQMKDKVVPNNSQVKHKSTQVEDHHRIPSISNKIKSVTVCNDSLNSRTSNANAVCSTCGKCLVDSDHFAYVTKMLNDGNDRTKKPNVVPISTRKPKGHANKFVATPHRQKVASKSITQKPKSYYRMLYEKTSKAWKWWIEQQCPSGYKWVPKTKMQWFAPILGYGDLVQGNIIINRVYYVEGLNHNLFSVGQFCDADLEVAFWKSTCFIRDLQGNDLLIGLWHRRLSHLNFDYINLLSKKDIVIGLLKLKYVKDQLCSSCEVSKEKRSSFKSKVVPSSKGRLNFLHMDLCGPMRVASINRKKYILLKEKGDSCILVGYSTHSKGYRVYNKRTRMIVESIHIRFDEIKEMSETSIANDTSGLISKRQKVSDYDNSDPVPQLQNVSSSADAHVPSQQELDLLFSQSIGTPMATKPKLDADLSGNPVDQTDYRSKIRSLMYLTSSRPDIVQALSDADHAGCIDTHKSTSGGIQFLGDKLVSWMSKKQNCTAMSSAEAEYVALSASCAQVITEYQLADMYTKALPEDRFKYLVRRIGMICLTPVELEVSTKESA